MGNILNRLKTIELKSRLKNTASCNSSCCVSSQENHNSTSYQMCRHCGSRVNLVDLDSKKEFARFF